jgi:RND family efflux transporter MFP subunit
VLRTILRIAALALCTAAPAMADTAAVKPVKLMTVVAGEHVPTRHFFGQVVARKSVDLAFQVGGELIEFPVREGEIVPKGALIARLDQETFQLSLEQARLQKDQADRTFSRLQKLSGNAVSTVTIDDAETEVQLAAIALKNAEYALEHTTLVAPFDALVASRNTSEFNMVGAGASVVRLHDMSEIRIEIDVPEILFQFSGDRTDVVFTAMFPAHETSFPVSIREFQAEADSIGQTFKITLGMEPQEGLNVLPGSSVNVTVSMGSETNRIVLPATALLPTGNDNELSVMVFTPSDDTGQGTVSRRIVKIEPQPTGKFLVLSGLEGGEEIVLTGGHALEDGQAVRRFTGFSN